MPAPRASNSLAKVPPAPASSSAPLPLGSVGPATVVRQAGEATLWIVNVNGQEVQARSVMDEPLGVGRVVCVVSTEHGYYLLGAF